METNSVVRAENHDMTEWLVEPQEQARDRLRASIALMREEVERLAALPGDFPSTRALVESWQTLVLLIAPQPEPLKRECPHCKRPMRLLATRCIQCLKKSEPPGAA